MLKKAMIYLALLPFGFCVMFLRLLGKLFGLTYKQISVVFNLWVQGGILALSGLAPFGIAVCKMMESFSVGWLALSAVLEIYGIAYVYAFIKMLRHYHLPFDAAFDLCVDDLLRLAKKWHTTYQIVNLLIFILFYLIIFGLNILICYCLYSLKLSNMEIYQIVLMVIGAITLVWMFYKAVKGFIRLLDAGLAGCFREKYPYDFKINLEWVISELKFRGYRQVAVIDAGGDYPGVMMKHPETGIEMEIRLRAPLLSDKGYSIVVANHHDHTAIVMQDAASDDNKRLLMIYLEQA